MYGLFQYLSVVIIYSYYIATCACYLPQKLCTMIAMYVLVLAHTALLEITGVTFMFIKIYSCCCSCCYCCYYYSGKFHCSNLHGQMPALISLELKLSMLLCFWQHLFSLFLILVTSIVSVSSISSLIMIFFREHFSPLLRIVRL